MRSGHRRAGRRLPAAQELAVARTHEGETTLHQPNGSVTQRGRLPRLPLEASRAEQHLGYLAIRSFGKVAIDCTQHEHETITALAGECKRFATVTCTPRLDSRPQAQRRLGARGEIIIQWHDDRQRLAWWSVRQAETKITGAVSDNDVSAILSDVLGTSTAELRDVKRPSPEKADPARVGAERS